MKKQFVLIAMLALFMAGNVFGAEMITKKSKRVVKPKPIVLSEIRLPYEAYAVADAETGEVLEGMNVQLPHPQASITKIMLAVVVVDKINAGELQLTDLITAPKKINMIKGTSVNLKAGEKFTLEKLMIAILVESANDAAYTVAEHVAGSTDAFAELMNQKARELGMVHTIYHSVNGLPPAKGGEDNLTNCVDMIILAQEALKSSKIREWTSIEYTVFRKSLITNHNRLLGKFPEVDGIKTGFTRAAGFNIVATGKNEDRRIIVVVLGSPTNKIRDHVAMTKFQEYLIKEGG
jgi:D-alanyl-D-alanine carboxypeptidase (penicillin-binding protein 5/6)